jgi:prophage antirepressor-like protein
MLGEQVHCFEQRDVTVVVCGGLPWFRAEDVTAALDYKDSAHAVRKNVNPKHVHTLSEVQARAPQMNGTANPIHPGAGKSPLYISEPGMYELLWHSKKPEALRFRDWVVEIVLPEIRRTGSYVRHKQMQVLNEADLHVKVVQFVRRLWPEGVMIAGLGELQDTSEKRLQSYHKGYTRGQPDLLFLNRTRYHNGLAIELKTPTGCGELSPDQREFLSRLRAQRFSTLVSECYDEIVIAIVNFRAAALRCRPRRSVA